MEHKPFPPDATRPPQSKFPWPIFAIIIAAVLLAVTIWFIPRTDRAATRTTDNAPLPANQLQVSEVSVSPQAIAGEANVDVLGQATNTGRTPVIDAVVSATFKDKNGASILVEQQPIERADAKGKARDVETKPFGQDPIRPGQTAGFRVRFSQVPANWNHQPPELTVAQVKVKK
jgi:hypothetical protein